MRALHLEFATSLAGRGALLLAFLVRGDRDLAAFYGFRAAGKLYHHQSGLDPEEGGASAGTVLQTVVLRDEVFGGGLREYDFLDGDEEYKFAWATGVRRLFDVVLYPESPRGRLRAIVREVARATLRPRSRRAQSMRARRAAAPLAPARGGPRAVEG